MSHRRRGGDFSHLLETFCDKTDCGLGLNSEGQDWDLSPRCSSVSEALDDHAEKSSKNSREADNSETCSYRSTILAGRAVDAESQESTESSYRTASSGAAKDGRSRDDDSCRSEIPSLMNRAIDIQFIPQSDLDLSKISGETRSSDEFNKNIETLEKPSHDARDTNYNIRNRVEVSTPNVPSYARRLGMDSPRPRRMGTPSTVDDSGAQIFRRLSHEFMSSPYRFTERLVTIIDESESRYDNVDNSGVELSRMTKEFRKMCKFIQDESMPEHMNSTLGMSRYNECDNIVNIRRPETIEESPNEVSTSEDVCTPEVTDACRKIYRKTPLNLFKKTVQDNHDVGSPGSPNSTKNFLLLEKYFNEVLTSPLSERHRQDLRRAQASEIAEQRKKDKMKLVQKSEQQLASLDDSNCQEYETFDSHPAHGTQKRENYDPRVDSHVHDLSIEDEPINEDELSMSLRLELEKKRERCFETARQMQKIEEDARAGDEDYPKVLERYGIDPETECRKTLSSLLAYKDCWAKIHHMSNVKRNDASSLDSGIDTRSISRTLQSSSKKSLNNEKLSKKSGKNAHNPETLMKNSKSKSALPPPPNFPRCRLQFETKNKQRNVSTPGNVLSKNAKTFMTNTRKSPGKLCPSARAPARSRSRSAEKSPQVRPVQSTTAKSSGSRHFLQPPKASPYVAQRPSATPDKTVKSPKNRFFTTPGKTVPVQGTRRRSKKLFPSLEADVQQRVMKSLHVPGIYRKGFNSSVISPVSMYIRGTDMNLMQNVRPRQNEKLSTPIKGSVPEEKVKFKPGPNTPRGIPTKQRLFALEKDEESESEDNDENEQEANFALPKTKYALPAHVRAIDQSPKIVGGARTRGLLQSMQNRVVIRHAGRCRKHDEHDVPESAADMSIHVQKSAEKTSYTNRWK